MGNGGKLPPFFSLLARGKVYERREGREKMKKKGREKGKRRDARGERKGRGNPPFPLIPFLLSREKGEGRGRESI